MTLTEIKTKIGVVLSAVMTSAMTVLVAQVIDHALAFVLISTLMILDVVTGIFKSLKTKRKIRSTIMFWGVIHKIVMLSLVLILSIIVREMFDFDIVNYLLVIGCIIEMRSIDENMTEATGFNFEKYIFVQIDKILKLKNKWEQLKKNENENNNNNNSTNPY